MWTTNRTQSKTFEKKQQQRGMREWKNEMKKKKNTHNESGGIKKSLWQKPIIFITTNESATVFCVCVCVYRLHFIYTLKINQK